MGGKILASPVLDEKRIKKLLRLLKKARTEKELTTALNVSRRTLYRDFARLEDRGIFVHTLGFRRPTKYFIAN
jgi:DeoR/GlpR family transcriptional regulator of sugar metabolism